MSELIADCPRCTAGAHTFDVFGDVHTSTAHGWMSYHEIMAVCRHCHRPSIFGAHITKSEDKNKFLQKNSLRAYSGTINDVVEVVRFVSIRDRAKHPAPDYLPEPIAGIFLEGTSSVSAGCPNAAGAMFRLCLDLATKARLPAADDDTRAQPDKWQRDKLANRLKWLFDQQMIPADLEGLASCVKEDGNDGSHDGTLTQADAEDLMDFTFALLDRLYTEPHRISEAIKRRIARRKPASR